MSDNNADEKKFLIHITDENDEKKPLVRVRTPDWIEQPQEKWLRELYSAVCRIQISGTDQRFSGTATFVEMRTARKVNKYLLMNFHVADKVIPTPKQSS